GSKRQLLKELLALTPPEFARYFEPFAGSACFFFALKPKKAMLNDINSELIDFYTALRKNPLAMENLMYQWEQRLVHFLQKLILSKPPNAYVRRGSLTMILQLS